MEIRDRVDDLRKNQKDILKQYEELIKEIDLEESINENIKLRNEIEEYRKTLADIRKHQEKLMSDNTSLNIALKEQILNEKMGILEVSKRKIELYFKAGTKEGVNSLSALEKAAKERLSGLKTVAAKELGQEKDEFYTRVDQIEAELEEKIKIKKEHLEQQREKSIDELDQEYAELKKQGVSEEVIQRKKKFNDIEVRIGLSWINKAGIILLLFGIATVMRHTYSNWLNAYMKGISGFVLGAVLLGVGEWFNRKRKNLFALGLTGGGIGVLYLSVFSSYFILDILTMLTSISVSILITLVALVLSRRYQSATICSLSLIGGYFPFFSYVFTEGLAGDAIYIAMGYLLILNVLVLGVSLGRRWIFINYLSFLLNIPCLVYLIYKSPSELISIGYCLLTFLMYLAITLSYPMIKKSRLRAVDIVLLGLNTVINCILVYGLFEMAEYGDFRGLIALVYALIYIGLGQLIQKNASQEHSAQALFYLTAITFSILMIPFQFGIEWASLGWLIEAVLLLYYATRRSVGKMEVAGWVILGLCVGNFALTDFISFWPVEHFILKYSLITLGLILVLSFYVRELGSSGMFRHTKKGSLLHGYKYFTIISTWIYALRMIAELFDRFGKYLAYDTFYYYICLALVTAGFAFLIGRIKWIKDKVVAGISVALFVLVDLLCFLMNFFQVAPSAELPSRIIPVAILVLYNVYVIWSIKDLTLRLIRKTGFSLEIYPMAMAVYFLGASVTLLVSQFDLGNINLIISIFLLVMALVYIALGFRKRFVILRRAGLALSVFSTAKLFIADLAFLETGGKIIAYFCFGLILIGISYVYDRVSRNIEKVEE